MNVSDCPTLVALLSDALDGAPGAAAVAAVLSAHAQHLAECNDCRARASGFVADDAALREMAVDRQLALPAPQLFQRIRDRIRSLPALLPGRVNDRELTDQEMNWLAAAGTGPAPDLQSDWPPNATKE